MASNLMTFRQLLVQHVDAGKPIPSFILKDDSNLGQAFARVAMSEHANEGETAGQTAGRYLDEICDALALDENKEALDAFNDTVSVFVSKVKNAWDNVGAIRETGRNLAAEMDKITNDQLQNNEYVSKHLNYSQLPTDFPVFTWEGTKAMGSIRDVVRHVNALVTTDGVEASDEVNQDLFNIVIYDMTRWGQVEDVQINEEARTAAISALLEVCNNAPAGTVENVVDAVTGINKNCPVHAALTQLKDLGYAQTHMMDIIKMFDDAITSFFPVLDLIICKQVIPVPSAEETVIENAKKIVTVLEIAAYYEYMKRTTYLSQVLLFQGGLINGDLEEEFKKAGGTSTMLAEYIRFMYADDTAKIPVSGATIKNITDGADNISVQVKKDIANVESRVALARNTARTTAFRIVIRDYLTKRIARDHEGEPGKVASLVEHTMQDKIAPIVEVIRQYDVNFIDAAMRAVVTTQYPGSFTEHLFDKLGTAYINATEMNGNISEADLRQIDVKVISKLIITFLVDNLVMYLPQA